MEISFYLFISPGNTTKLKNPLLDTLTIPPNIGDILLLSQTYEVIERTFLFTAVDVTLAITVKQTL